MNNFCTKCGSKISKDDNFCGNCGSKIIKEDNFCIKCGTELREDDKYCMNCGTKVNNSDITQENNIKSVPPSIEEDESTIAKKEEENKKLKILDEIFESEETKSEIRENNIDPMYAIFIKDNIRDELINKEYDMLDGEIEFFIKTELKKAIKEQRKARLLEEKEMRSKKEENEMIRGGYCDLNCRHCYEEIIDSGGGITGDYDDDMCGVEYYCRLGHSLVDGRFCEDYE